MEMSAKTEQIEPTFSRREWLHRTLQLSLAVALSAIAAGCQKSGALVCGDPAQLSDAEKSLRTSLHYTEKSAQIEQVCAGCGFFEGPENAACGTCTLLEGPVNTRGRCDSWHAAKR